MGLCKRAEDVAMLVSRERGKKLEWLVRSGPSKFDYRVFNIIVCMCVCVCCTKYGGDTGRLFFSLSSSGGRRGTGAGIGNMQITITILRLPS